MSQKYDAIVIGTGGVGSATLYELSKRYSKVLGLDRFPDGHDRGSSHGETRAIRQAYFEHPNYVPLLLRAYELWQQLELESKRDLLHLVGVLEIGPIGSVIMNGIREAADQHQLSLEVISRNKFNERFPGFVLPENYEALFEPTGGYLLVEECVKSYLDLARKNSTDVHSGIEVLDWTVDDDGVVTIQTDQREYQTDRLVITVGAWANQLLPDLNLDLKVLRKHQLWYSSENQTAYHEKNGTPVFFYETEDGCFYGFPQRDLLGVKVAEHTGGDFVENPLLLNRSLDKDHQKRIEKFLSTYAPQLSLEMSHHAACMYTVSSDEHFIVDKHPNYPQIVFAAGLSGHGFKFASVLGEALVDLVCDGSTSLPIDFLKLQRNN